MVRIHGLLSLLHIGCFCFPVNMMTRRQSRAAPTVPPAPRPQKRAAQATRESLKAKRSKSAARFLIPTAVNPPRNIPPNWSLFLLPATTKPLPQWTSCHSLRSRARMTPNSRHISSSSEGARWCERDSGCCCTGVSSGRNSGHYR